MQLGEIEKKERNALLKTEKPPDRPSEMALLHMTRAKKTDKLYTVLETHK